MNKPGIIAYIRNRNPNPNIDLDRLIQIYIDEARDEGINLDIAIAQMLYATNFLSDRQRMQNHNYAGLSTTPGWNGSFSSMERGVRAHRQHTQRIARVFKILTEELLVSLAEDLRPFISGTASIAPYI